MLWKGRFMLTVEEVEKIMKDSEVHQIMTRRRLYQKIDEALDAKDEKEFHYLVILLLSVK